MRITLYGDEALFIYNNNIYSTDGDTLSVVAKPVKGKGNPSKVLSSIYADSAGVLVGMEINRVYETTDKKNWRLLPPLPQINRDWWEVWLLARDKEASIWAGYCEHTIFRLKPGARVWEKVKVNNMPRECFVYDSFYLIGDYRSFDLYKWDGKKFLRVFRDTKAGSGDVLGYCLSGRFLYPSSGIDCENRSKNASNCRKIPQAKPELGLYVVGENGRVLCSKDSLRTFNFIRAFTKSSISGVAVNKYGVFVCGEEGLLMFSGDSGKSFVPIESNLKGDIYELISIGDAVVGLGAAGCFSIKRAGQKFTVKPGICNRHEDRDERGRCFCDEKS